MDRRLRELPPPANHVQLQAQLHAVWNAIPQHTIDHLIDGMPRRIQSCIAARGGPIPY